MFAHGIPGGHQSKGGRRQQRTKGEEYKWVISVPCNFSQPVMWSAQSVGTGKGRRQCFCSVLCLWFPSAQSMSLP